MKAKGEDLLRKRPVSEAEYDIWRNSSVEYIERTFGSFTEHVGAFLGPTVFEVRSYGGGNDEHYRELGRADQLKQKLDVLGSLIAQIDLELTIENSLTAPAMSSNDAIWSLLHPKVTSVSRARFEGGHFADSVEAALKELNSVVKELVRKKTGQELDGAPLMQKAFSANPPVLIALDDLTTDSGKNVQQGYMQIFAGVMTGIRNPKAHENLTISKEAAIHHLFLASLLFSKLDERV